MNALNGSTTALVSIGTRAVKRQTIRLIGYPLPFKPERFEASVPVGQTVADYLGVAGVSHRGGVHCWLNESYLPETMYAHVRPKAGSTLMFRVLPRGGGLLRSILFLAVAAAAVVASIFVPPAILGVGAAGPLASLVGVGAGLAVSVAGSLLINALIPVRPPQLAAASGGNPAVSGGGRPEASPTFSLTAPRNDLRPWGPIPVILGRHRVTPPYAAHPYTEIVDNDQFIRALFVWGYGPLDITDVRLGETPISQFADVQIEHRQGFPTDAPITLVTQPVFEDSLSIQLLAEAGFQQRTTVLNTDAFTVDIVLPNGLGQLGTDGRLLQNKVNLQIDFRRVGDATWTTLVLPGTEVAIGGSGFTLGTAFDGAEPKTKASRIWVNTNTSSLELVQQAGTAPIGSSEFPPLPSHARSVLRMVVTGDTLTTLIQERHDDLAGFQYKHETGRQLTVEGGRWFSSPATFEGSTQTAIRRSMAATTVARGQFDIRIKRVTPDTDDPSMSDDIYWGTLRSFRNMPVVSFSKPLAMTAVRIRASDQLNGPLDELNGVVMSILPHWNGTAWVTQTTQDPAAMFRAILQGPASAIPLPDSEIDLPSLQAWSGYAQGKALTFNMVRDFRSSNWDALLDVCSAGRATIGLQDGKWRAVVDELGVGQPPVQHFGRRNSWDFRAEKPYREIPHAFRLRYLNEAQGWTQQEAFAYRDGFSAANATLYEQLELPGQTNQTLIIKQGRFHFAQALLRPETYSFSVDFEHLLCHRGSRIRVTHDVPLWGIASGRVKAVNGQVITLDEVVTMQGGRQYAVRFRLANGSSIVRSVMTDAQEVDTIVLLGSGGLPAVGDLFLFGEAESESASLVVVRIEPSDNLTARLFCVDEAPGIHQADSGPIAIWDPQITLPSEFRLIDGGEFEGGGRWVFDDPAAMVIVLDETRARHGRSALRLTAPGTEEWARPNGNLPKRVPPGAGSYTESGYIQPEYVGEPHRIYVEAWAKALNVEAFVQEGYVEAGFTEPESDTAGQIRLALGWFTSMYYLFHAQRGPAIGLAASYRRLRVDALVPDRAHYVHFQLGTTGQTGDEVWVDDVLALSYVLPVVETGATAGQNNYLQMQDQTGAIWHLSILEGWPSMDDQLTIGTRANIGATLAWISRQSPNLTTWYLYPATDGTLTVSTVQPPVGAGSAGVLALIDKRTWRTWNVGVTNDGTYQLVEAA